MKQYRVMNCDSELVAVFYKKHLAEAYAFNECNHIFEWTDGKLTGVSDIKYCNGQPCGMYWQWFNQHQDIQAEIDRRERQQLDFTGVFDVR